MKKVMSKKAIFAGAAILLAIPGVASAVISGGLIGDCADCHTMHNSEQGNPVAKIGTGTGTITASPIQNLLRLDCVACHASNPTGGDKIWMKGDSAIPQVMHADATGDLAGGNFSNITTGGNRKGHNVSDLFVGGDTTNTGTYAAPPGKYRASTHGNGGTSTNQIFGTAGSFSKFSCAGAGGCHGTRNQLLTASINSNQVWDTAANTLISDGPDYFDSSASKRRIGLPAITGSHHNNWDGQKDAPQNVTGVHDGAKVAKGYRFIPGLKGYGNEAARWQNVDADSHNEYYGKTGVLTGSSCGVCHVDSSTGGNVGGSHVGMDSTLVVPNQSVSGFCATCHGTFHSAGSDGPLAGNGVGGTGVSGAFLRHPSDYVIPNTGEYAAYTSYNLTAPVARQTLADAASNTVTPGSDMVMCLSCHVAHASAFDGMLRYDYTEQTAGTGPSGAGMGKGCLACHTTKGLLKDNNGPIL